MNCFKCGGTTNLKKLIGKSLSDGNYYPIKINKYLCNGCYIDKSTKYKYYCSSCSAFHETPVCTRCIRIGKIQCHKCRESITNEPNNYEHIRENRIFVHTKCIERCSACNKPVMNSLNSSTIGKICDTCAVSKNMLCCNACNILYESDKMFSKGTHNKECASRYRIAPVKTKIWDEKHANKNIPKFNWGEFFGIELEYMGHPRNHTGWNNKYDRSCGYEFVSPVLDDSSNNFIYDLVEAHQDDIITNELCAFHIHISTHNKSTRDIQKILTNFITLREWIFSHQPKYRSKSNQNPMTKRLYNTQKIHDREDIMLNCNDMYKFWDVYYGKFEHRKVQDKWNSNRYSPLNLHSYLHMGTIEFRYPASFFNFKWIYENINLAMCIFKAEHKVNNINDILSPESIVYWDSLKRDKFSSLIVNE